MSHTKGPWQRSGSSIETADQATVICDMRQPVGRNWTHDARLIAAAPELLEALQNITECAEAGADGVNMDLWVQHARQAIAKATGIAATE